MKELRGKLEQPVAEIVRRALEPPQPVSPEAAHEFEVSLAGDVREIGRIALEHVMNAGEPEEEMAARVRFGGETYRRRKQTPNKIASLFGWIFICRYVYEPLERIEKCIHPLEIQWGIEAGIATSALAERIGHGAGMASESTVSKNLARDQGITLSKMSLRAVTASVSEGLAGHLHEAQVAELLELLAKANQSRGRPRPVLSVGRDGVTAPIRGNGFREGSAATLAVFNRKGKRLGTIYLARMPESGQIQLSNQLTSLTRDGLRKWHGPMPRLAYVSDDGHHPRDYYRRVLECMADPRRPGHLNAKSEKKIVPAPAPTRAPKENSLCSAA